MSSAKGKRFTFQPPEPRKIDTLSESLALYLKIYGKSRGFFSFGQTPPPSPETKVFIRLFATTLPALWRERLHFLSKPILASIFRAIPLFHQHLNDIPEAAAYVDLMTQTSTRPKDFLEESWAPALRSLLQCQAFYELLLETNSLRFFFEFAVCHKDISTLLATFRTCFLAAPFLAALRSRLDSLDSVLDLLISDRSEWIRGFLVLVVAILSNVKLNLSFRTQFFSKLNNFLCESEIGLIWQLYELMLFVGGNRKTMDGGVLMRFNDLYRIDGTSLSLRIQMLETIHEQQLFLFTGFLLVPYLLPTVCTDSTHFQRFIQLIVDCAGSIPGSARSAIRELIVQMAPVQLRPAFLYQELFEFLNSEVIWARLDFEDLDVLFLEKFWGSPDFAILNKIAGSYPGFIPLFVRFFARWKSPQLMMIARIFEFIKMGQYTQQFLTLLTTSFSSGIMEFVLENLEKFDFQWLIGILPAADAFLDYFEQVDGWAIIDRMSSDSYWKLFLRLVKIIGNPKHFFDEWVVRLPASHPIFSFDRDFLLEFADDPFDLFLPSLLPLVPVQLAEPVSEYNLYLMGRYSLPVCRKLQLKSCRIPSFDEILRRYVTIDDFFYFVHESPVNVEFACALRPVMELRVLEFHTTC
jgi:hypothetical protein